MASLWSRSVSRVPGAAPRTSTPATNPPGAKSTVQPVRVDTRVEDLISVAADQNFVPVVDDKGDFIGIVTRSRILKYCLQTGFLHE